MRICILLLLILLCPAFGHAQETINLDDLLQAGEQLLKDNLDEKMFEQLQQVDRDKVQQMFGNLQQQLQGEYVIDLARLKPTVNALLPLLESYSEAQPYAAWLRARLDYFDVADEFRLSLPAPKPIPGQAPRPVPNPSPETERKVWQKQLAKRPLPKGAERYVPVLKPIFAAQQVPPQLVWLAEVESSFNPLARSPVGAAGLYQLMPPTAQQLGLALRPEDERLVPDKNAQAAARYLKYLHQKFRDWPLTMAAYNAGEGRVQNLLDRYKAKSFEGIATHLPAETQFYVPKVEATLQRREGVSLGKLNIPTKTNK